MIRHWEKAREGGCLGRIIRESESLPAQVDVVSIHAGVNHWSSLYLELHSLIVADHALLRIRRLVTLL